MAPVSVGTKPVFGYHGVSLQRNIPYRKGRLVLKLDSAAATIVIASLVALGPLATDLYLPALPAMGDALGAGPEDMQLTLSVYMAGFAIAQLLCGPLSDRFGRKPVMLGMTASAAAGIAMAVLALRGVFSTPPPSSRRRWSTCSASAWCCRSPWPAPWPRSRNGRGRPPPCSASSRW